jgi:Zn-dependent protease with chaperone function
MLNDILKNLGLFIILIGIIILVVSFLNGITSNSGLIVALLLIVFGFASYLLTNRFMQD